MIRIFELCLISLVLVCCSSNVINCAYYSYQLFQDLKILPQSKDWAQMVQNVQKFSSEIPQIIVNCAKQEWIGSIYKKVMTPQCIQKTFDVVKYLMYHFTITQTTSYFQKIDEELKESCNVIYPIVSNTISNISGSYKYLPTLSLYLFEFAGIIKQISPTNLDKTADQIKLMLNRLVETLYKFEMKTQAKFIQKIKSPNCFQQLYNFGKVYLIQSQKQNLSSSDKQTYDQSLFESLNKIVSACV